MNPFERERTMNANRLTSLVTFTGMTDHITETVRLCWPGCLQQVLTDEAVPHPKPQGGLFPRRGSVEMVVAWSGRARRVEWRRNLRPNRLLCHLCGDEWNTRDSQRNRAGDR